MCDCVADGHDHFAVGQTENEKKEGELLPLHGSLDDMVHVFRGAYSDSHKSATAATHQSAAAAADQSAAAVADRKAADWAMVLTLLFRYKEAIDVLEKARANGESPLCTLLLCKALFLSCDHVDDRFERCENILREIDGWSGFGTEPCRRVFKSLYSYTHMISDIMRRERRGRCKLQTEIGPKMKIMHVIGDSHICSLAHRKVCAHYYLTPLLVTGLKAWHLRRPGVFTSQSLMHALHKCEGAHGVLLSAGEIDIREGISLAVRKGLYSSIEEAIDATSTGFVSTVAKLAEEHEIEQIYVLPVIPPPRGQTRGGKFRMRQRRARHTKLWNAAVAEKAAAESRVVFLDYVDAMMDRVDGESLDVRFALSDHTHANSNLVALLERELLKFLK